MREKRRREKAMGERGEERKKEGEREREGKQTKSKEKKVYLFFHLGII